MRKILSESNNYGKLLLLIGVLLAVPLVVLTVYPDERKYLTAFIVPSIGSISLGLTVCILAPRREGQVTEWQSPLQSGSLPVLLVWSYAFLLGALPFVMGGQSGFMFALFESVSGWTTTGLTVMDVTALPRIFLFHRAFMQFCGGLGFIIMIAMLVQGKQSMNLYSAEGHSDRLMPSLQRTSRTIFLLYSAFLVAGTAFYRIFGMGLFDAVCHAMSALSTAGFTTQAGSIGQYESWPIEAITIILMLVGGSNFAVLLLIIKGRFRRVLQVSEVRFMIGLVLLCTVLTAAALVRETGMGVLESFRHALFGVVSTFSTSGYSTMDYAVWPPFAVGILMVLMLIGASAGSTSGGIKLVRVYLLARITKENVLTRLSPARRVSMLSYTRAQGKAAVDNSVINDTVGFIACYIAVLIAGTLLLTLTQDCSLSEAMFGFASALGTTGVSGGLTGAGASAGSLIVLIAGMVLGRLEIFIVFIGIYSALHMGRRQVRKVAAGIRNRTRKG